MNRIYEKPSTTKHESKNIVQGSLYYVSLHYTSLYHTSLYYRY